MGNWIPKSIIKGIDSNGNKIRLEEWNYGDIGSGTGLLGSNFLPILITILIFTVIASPLLFLISMYFLINDNKRTIILNFLGIIIGSYFLFDMYNDWYISQITLLWFDFKTISGIVGLTLSGVITNTIMLIIPYFNLVKLKHNFENILIISIFTIFFAIGIKQAPQIAKERIKYAKKIDYCIKNKLDSEHTHYYMLNN